MNLTKHWAAVLSDYVIDLAWSPDGSLLAAASSDGPVSVLKAADGAKLHELPGHENGTNCLSWKPGQAPSLATGGQDGTVKIWDPVAGQHVSSAKMGNAWIEHLAWRPDGSTVAAAAGRELSLINADGSERHRFKPAPKTISAIAWQPKGGCLAAAYFGGVCLWDGDDFIVQKEFAYNNGIHALVWSPDSKWLVSGNQDPSVHLWVPDTDLELNMSGYEGKVKELSFDLSSRWLATGGGKDACIWDCAGAGPEGREPLMLPHDTKICAVAFQNKHGLLASASEDGVLMLWSPDRKQPLRATVRMPSPATKLAWSPNDELLAIGSAKGTVYVLKCAE
jgi:WD40 repeat protein